MQADSAAKDVAALDAEIEQMRKKAAEIRAKEALLEAKVKEGKEWLAENEGALSKKPEDMLPTNELDAQIIELTAESNALDDMVCGCATTQQFFPPSPIGCVYNTTPTTSTPHNTPSAPPCRPLWRERGNDCEALHGPWPSSLRSCLQTQQSYEEEG